MLETLLRSTGLALDTYQDLLDIEAVLDPKGMEPENTLP
jgi:hypothetical protein